MSSGRGGAASQFRREDLIQQATVIAAIAYDAAMRDEMLPRKGR